MKRKGFTPLETVKKHGRDGMSLTGFTPLETIGRQDKSLVSLTGFTPLETTMKQRKAKMSLTGFTLVEIIIVGVVIALLVAIAIPNLLAARRVANEAHAKATIWSLSIAAETFFQIEGDYPYINPIEQLTAVMSSVPDYCADWWGEGITTVQGYNYSCTVLPFPEGYTFVAWPVTLGVTGNVTYTATTGGVLTPLY